jgi:hypothetical protein
MGADRWAPLHAMLEADLVLLGGCSRAFDVEAVIAHRGAACRRVPCPSSLGLRRRLRCSTGARRLRHQGEGQQHHELVSSSAGSDSATARLWSRWRLVASSVRRSGRRVASSELDVSWSRGERKAHQKQALGGRCPARGQHPHGLPWLLR